MKKEVLEAIEELYNNYDAFYISNKYGDGTHKKEFDMLIEVTKGDEKAAKAIGWIKNCYDCYYNHEYPKDTGTAFDYLRNFKEEKE